MKEPIDSKRVIRLQLTTRVKMYENLCFSTYYMDYAELKNEDGYMVDPSKWSKEYAEWRAAELDIELTEKHWHIVDLFREFIGEKGITPSSRIAQKEAKKRFGVDSKGFYALFPNGPKQTAMVAGGIKPSGC